MTSILLVEDNAITRKLVKFALEGAKFVVLEAPDGATGLRMFEQERVSLVLLDLLLPDGEGFDFLPKFRELPNGREVPILAFSGMLTAYEDSKVASMGFDDVVSKPVEPSQLLQIIRAHLPQATQPARAVETRTLVIADDDPVQRKLVAMRLQRAGYEVSAAADGEEALGMAQRLRPAAIVSDVLMPRLDGFGLCVAVRSDPTLANTPLLLISNSYLEDDDRKLAVRVGADDLILRTPELIEVIATLQSPRLIARMDGRALPPMVTEVGIEHDRIERMTNQLERQLAHQGSLSQRCSLLSAELSVLSGISAALTRAQVLEDALHEVLASCFDAGGISSGVLYLQTPDGLRGIAFGGIESAATPGVDSFFGHAALLEATIKTQTFLSLPTEASLVMEGRDLLEATRASSMLIAPLGYKGEPLGALVTMSSTRDLQASDRIAFAQAVAGQISVALALARSFQAKDASEREARATAAVLRSILDSMADGVVVADDHCNITAANAAASDFERAVKHPAFPLKRALAGEAIDQVEVFVQNEGAGDTGQWVSVRARPLSDGSRGAVAVCRDVTQDKAAQSQLLVNDRMAALGMLAAGVGHEINNPLMAVLGNLEMAVKDLNKLIAKHADVEFGELSEELRDAHDAATRVRNIVRDLKLFSRADADTRGAVDVAAVLESSVRIVWNEIRHRARLVRDFQPVPSVNANESRLGQVFLNLIVNAVQAMPEGHADDNEIRVSSGVADDGRVCVTIADTGCGMPPDVVSRIFTPFFTTKPIGVGTGLGLAICHQLVAAVGGEISLETEVGKGTTFRVLLPVGDAPVIARPRTTTRPNSGLRGKVLVIDDEPAVGATIRRALRTHEVTAITDGRDAITRITNGERFDAILCDLMMPAITGMDLHAEILELAPDQARRMVFITGGAFTTAARAFLEKIPNRQIEKPIEIDSLRAVIEEQIRAPATT